MHYLILETNFTYCLCIKSSEASFEKYNFTMPPIYLLNYHCGYWVLNDK